jgi:hypothetical protein
MARKRISTGMDGCTNLPFLPPNEVASDGVATGLHGDLLVEIYPRASVVWEGTGTQLVAEGLIPDRFNWPVGAARTCWFDGRFESNLWRVRPPGMEGMRSTDAAQGDWWRLVRYQILPIRRLHDARLYARQCEIEHERWRNSAAGRRMRERHCASQCDAEFQIFKQALGIPA